MNRSNYSDIDDDLALGRWRGQVASAIRGKRGQKFLRDLREALDAMPVKRLIANEFQRADSEVCAVGALVRHTGILLPGDWTIHGDARDVIRVYFDIADPLAAELLWVNDGDGFSRSQVTPEQRWQRVRNWVEANIHAQDARATN